jgi:hypothetical protein
MDKTKILILVFVMAFLAFRIYQKYAKKTKNASRLGGEKSKNQQFENDSKDDDYEPYSQK